MTLERALKRAEDSSDEALETLLRLVAQPSISTRNEGVRECAAMLQDVMGTAGITTRLLPTEGQPGDLR